MRKALEQLKKLFPGRLTNTQIFIFQFLVALVIFHPYLINEFFADDYFFISILKSKTESFPIAGFWSVDLKDYDSFQNLWWKDENAHAKFFRPLPSLFFSLIYFITPKFSALILHFFSILLHSLVALSVFMVLNKFSKIYSVSLLASFIFLISEDHSMTIGWIATNTDLFAVLFINLALYYHVKFRETSISLHRKLSKIYMTVSFFCKETAVIGPIAIILYEFILLESQNPEKNIFKRFYQKLLLLVKNQNYWRYHFFLIFVFLVFYRITGFGVNTLMYIDPFRKPAEYIKNVVVGLPTMLVGLLTNFPIGLLLFEKNLTYPLMISGIILYFIFSALFAPHWKNRIIHYSFLLFTISLLPQLIALPSERLLYFPSVFGSYLIAYFIFNISFLKKFFLPENPVKLKILSNIFGIYLLISSVIVALYLSLIYPEYYISEFQKLKKPADEISVYFTPETKNIIFLTMPSIFHTFYLNDIIKFEYPDSKQVYTLSSFNGEMKIKKLDDYSFLLESNSPGWINNLFAKIVRVYPNLEVGKKYNTRLFTATILKTTINRKDLQSVKFEFKNLLNDSSNLIVYHDGENVFKLDIDTLQSNKIYRLKKAHDPY